MFASTNAITVVEIEITSTKNKNGYQTKELKHVTRMPSFFLFVCNEHFPEVCIIHSAMRLMYMYSDCNLVLFYHIYKICRS